MIKVSIFAYFQNGMNDCQCLGKIGIYTVLMRKHPTNNHDLFMCSMFFVFRASKHLDLQDVELLDGEGDRAKYSDEESEMEEEDEERKEVKAQDFHATVC